MGTMTPYQVAVAAEASAASLFAQAGYDVLVQYGANQPEYDLIVAQKDRMLKVSVKGSQDGGWGLIQSFLKGGDYHEAVNLWVKNHKSTLTVYCLVQFKGIKLGESPKLYLATIEELAIALNKSRNGYGDTVLRVYHKYRRGLAANTIDEIPVNWLFSQERVEQLFKQKAIS